MRFDELEEKMRKYETVNDRHAPLDMFLIARLDGRGFTKLAKEINLSRPFDENFDLAKDLAIKHLIENSGFDIIYAYHQSDEISLLFKYNTDIFGRNHRKYNSLLASFLSTKFLEVLLDFFPFLKASPPQISFDCRLIELPSASLVKDYFSWRQQDAGRNGLNTYCYWMLRRDGLSGSRAHSEYSGLSVTEKHELLFKKFNINYSQVPKWQINGTAIYWETYQKEGFNPLLGQTLLVDRKKLVLQKELEFGEPYRNWLEENFLKTTV